MQKDLYHLVLEGETYFSVPSFSQVGVTG